MSEPGRLVLVGTPIGNLGDMAPRAVEALLGADVVCCEDTRRTGRLLKHFGIRAPRLLVSNEHTEASVADEVVGLVAAGQVVAVVSDAGMPGISDPGERIVAAAIDAGLVVEAVPGPAAAVTALVLSGLPGGRFVFEGFLPRKGSGRTERLAAVASERRTVVLYEAPHRLERTLDDLIGVCGPDRQVSLSRELTKLHEETVRTSLAEARARLSEHPARGEYVIVLAGAPERGEIGDGEILDAISNLRARGISTRDAATEVAVALGVPRRRVYELATSAGPAR